MGRQQKDKSNILIQNLNVNYLTKSDNYGNEFIYFKIVDKDKKSKFKMIQNVVDSNDGLKVPFFQGDNNATILRIKEKFITAIDILEFEKKTYTADIVFEFYNFNPDGENEISGYYCKMPLIRVADVQSD